MLLSLWQTGPYIMEIPGKQVRGTDISTSLIPCPDVNAELSVVNILVNKEWCSAPTDSACFQSIVSAKQCFLGPGSM